LAPGTARMAAYDLQRSFSKRQDKHTVDKPVFITGLARSGSTTLLNLLYDTQQFRSLTYQDMPFIMMPGIWQSMRGESAQETTPRRGHTATESLSTSTARKLLRKSSGSHSVNKSMFGIRY
jgi:hypothetical protein